MKIINDSSIKETFNINGNTYHSLEEIPELERAILEKARKQYGVNNEHQNIHKPKLHTASPIQKQNLSQALFDSQKSYYLAVIALSTISLVFFLS